MNHRILSKSTSMTNSESSSVGLGARGDAVRVFSAPYLQRKDAHYWTGTRTIELERLCKRRDSIRHRNEWNGIRVEHVFLPRGGHPDYQIFPQTSHFEQSHCSLQVIRLC